MSGSAPRDPIRRWGLPMGVVWAELMLSAFVLERRLPERAIEATSTGTLGGILLGLPALSLVLLLMLRRLDRAPSTRSAAGDAIVIWLLAALFAAHALVLAVAMGAVSGLHPGLALVAGFLLIGVAAVLPSLPWRSPMGVTTRATLADAGVWARVHREVATGAAVSGALALGSALLPVALLSAAALVPAAATLGRSVLAPPRPSSAEDQGEGEERAPP